MSAGEVPAVVLGAVGARLGIDTGRAEFLQHSVHAIYRVADADLVLRLSTGPGAAAAAEQLVRVARELDASAVPVARLAPGLPQPVWVDGWAATAWVRLPPPPVTRLPVAELATPLRALHSVTLSTPLPAWDLLGGVRTQLVRVRSLTGAAAQAVEDWSRSRLELGTHDVVRRLEAHCEEVAAGLDDIEWALAPCVVHGDAHTGNLLREPGGRVVLCDLDSVSWGPPEADLAPSAHGVVRFGRDAADQARCVASYGFDVLGWSGWDVLRRLRDLQLVTCVLAELDRLPAIAEELAHRTRTVLDGSDARWHRYPHVV